MAKLHIARFAAEVTPPVGHPLCGGWIDPVRGVDDPLEARGIVLLGMGRPVVLCAVDWCELRNDSYEQWRGVLAEAAHTVPANVAVQCVHQHDAPMADLGAQRLLSAVPGAPANCDPDFHRKAARATADAIVRSMAETSPFDRVGVGMARVDRVASARRVLGPDGKVKYVRTSATRDPAARDAPEGAIDPDLRTLGFWRGETPLAALHYYATHPMSHYGAGRVSADFCGLARRKRQDEMPKVHQVYFNGCGGDVTAGKYNDGSPENREVLRDRVHLGMVDAWKATTTHPVAGFEWKVEPVTLPSRAEPAFGAEASRRVLEDGNASKAERGNAALQLAWLERRARPIDVTCLDFGRAAVVHLPGEPFVAYQRFAQGVRNPVFVAGYGDGGTGYIPTAEAYAQGGYEPTVALVGPGSDRILRDAMTKLLKTGRG